MLPLADVDLVNCYEDYTSDEESVDRIEVNVHGLREVIEDQSDPEDNDTADQSPPPARKKFALRKPY